VPEAQTGGNMRKLMAIFAMLLMITGLAFAKKANVMNVEKGELPNDTGGGITINLSEENSFSKGGVSLKVEAATYPTTDMFFGEYQPKKGVWDGFDYLRFEYVNPGKTPMGLILTVKPEGSDYTTRLDQPLMFAPGKHAIEIELTGACSNNGTAIDWKKKLKQWNINGKLAGPLYIGNVQLLGADDLEKLNGGGDDKAAKPDAKKEKKAE